MGLFIAVTTTSSPLYGSIEAVSGLISTRSTADLLFSHLTSPIAAKHFNTWQNLNYGISLHAPFSSTSQSVSSVFAVCLWPQWSVFQAPFTPAVLCIWKSRVKRGCPLRTHTFASTLYLPEGATSLSGGFCFSQHFVLIFPSSALTQGVESVVTAIIASISVAASVTWNSS